MNFYIGNSIDEVDIQSDNVEFSDELIEFIYKLRKHVPFDMSKLYEINLYMIVKLYFFTLKLFYYQNKYDTLFK